MQNKSHTIYKAISVAEKLDSDNKFRISDLYFDKLIKVSNKLTDLLKKKTTDTDKTKVNEKFIKDFMQDLKSESLSPEELKMLPGIEKNLQEYIGSLSEKITFDEDTDTEDDEVYFDPNSDGFENAFKHILNVEGGFTPENKASGDPRTNFGIIQSEYDNYRNKKGLSQKDVKFISKEEVEEIYYYNYWQPMRGDVLYARLPLTTIAIFDFAVNSDISGASNLVSRSLQIVNGRFNDQMISDIVSIGEQYGDSQLKDFLINERYSDYERIIANNPKKSIYSKGWQNRLDKLNRYLGQ